MNGRCATGEELLRHVEGELTRNQSLALETHARECANCRADLGELHGVLDAIAAPPPLPERDLVAGVRERAALPPPRRFWQLPAFRVLAAGAALAGVVIAAGVGVARRSSTAGFQARGGATSPDAWVRLRAYRATPSGRALQLAPGEHIHANEPLLFAYDNSGPAPLSYLFIVGVQPRARAYWYYPALAADGADGASVPARRGAAIELPDEVRHALAPGPLRLFAVFSPAPLTVREVERLLGAVADPTALERLPVAASAQHSLLVTVDGD